METFWDLDNIYPKTDSILTVGTFDGIHLGHIEIINQLISRAKKSDAKSTLVTFEPHPGLVIGKRGPTPLALLTTIEEKIDVLASIGLERLVITNFTGSFASMTAEEFVHNILIKKLSMKQIVIGHDHSFGKDRKGNFNLLAELGKEYNFKVDTIDPVRVNNEIISSTKIEICYLTVKYKKRMKLSAEIIRYAARLLKATAAAVNWVFRRPIFGLFRNTNSFPKRAYMPPKSRLITNCLTR